MRKVLILCILLLGARFASAQQLVQVAETAPNSSAQFASLTLTFPKATTAGDAIVCFASYGTQKVTAVFSDDRGDSYAIVGNAWDSGHSQGLVVAAAFAIASGSSKVQITFSSWTNYDVTVCEERSGLISLGTSAVAVGSPQITPAAGDFIWAAVTEDSVGSGDSFVAGNGFTLALSDGANSVATESQASAVGSPIAPGFGISPSGRSSIQAIVAFHSAFQLKLPNCCTLTFPISSTSQLPACAAVDGVCSLAIQVCDLQGHCLISSTGTLSIVKTVSLPAPQSSSVIIVKASP